MPEAGPGASPASRATENDGMTCVSVLSTHPASEAAIDDVLARASAGLGGPPADLAVAFVSSHHAEALGTLAERVVSLGLARHLIGCTGESIVGEDREVEESPAISLWAIHLPGVEVKPIRMGAGPTGFDDLEGSLSPQPSGERFVIVLGDPFTFPADPWLRGMNDSYPGLRILGGMASAGQAPGQNRLVLDDKVQTEGAVGVVLEGPLSIRTIVSQGCRPIGRPMIVTRAEENVINELGRRAALDALKETYEALDPEEQELVRGGLHIGRVINEYQETFGRGDFLVRNVLGADETGGIGITDQIRVGVTVQFHVRDAETADEDLRSLLDDVPSDRKVAGALLITCNGRGSRLFRRPNHDVAALQDAFGPIPVAGFFAMGEIGTVGGQNFLHGFTASIALFETTG